ncbi:SMC-Scp complex subunit ScpB [Roseospirillum parvum]|uniref:Segregation and condensation protein B n=1 Tax=Roseospirillum parvum TaxID=83401 RepID=A0A1G7YIE0_9PROT|nr:SMC-Scp complex subunit ScpB [Roseospirillum parvum]SDG96144.1 segregation and condensation protein B [Roseospirillum parvum]
MTADETRPTPESAPGIDDPAALLPLPEGADLRPHARIAEALLFAAPRPLTPRELAERLPRGCDVGQVLDSLRADYQGRGVHLVKLGEGYAFRSAPDLAPYLTEHRNETRKLSRAAVETLAIIAYHQPVTRAEIEEIRGVALSRGTLDVLLEAGWIGPRGRRQSPGRPLTWGTSDSFLDHFGLGGLDELPGIEDLRAAGLLDSRPAIAAYGARADELPLEEEDDPEDDPEA